MSHSLIECLVRQVQLKPDLQATSFSEQNAYFFAKMSSIAYKSKSETEGLIKGNATHAGLGFDYFHWFQVGYSTLVRLLVHKIYVHEGYMRAS